LIGELLESLGVQEQELVKQEYVELAVEAEKMQR
jgi:hypothetical protein